MSKENQTKNNYQYVRGNLASLTEKDGRVIMNVAVNSGSTENQTVDFIKTMASGKSAEAILKREFKKGDLIQVEGEASFNEYENKDGKTNKGNTLFVRRAEKMDPIKGQKLEGAWRNSSNVVEMNVNLTYDARKVEGRNAAITEIKAVNNVSYQVADEWKTKTNFFEGVTFEDNAKNAETLKKGDGLAVVGKVKNSSYEDKDGDKRYSVNVIVDKFEKQLKKETTLNKDAESKKEVETKKVEAKKAPAKKKKTSLTK